jgi:hypothetical protein
MATLQGDVNPRISQRRTLPFLITITFRRLILATLDRLD